jgi:hypothetical protein
MTMSKWLGVLGLTSLACNGFFGCIGSSVNSVVVPPQREDAKRFPQVTVADLEGTSRSLPNDFRADVTLLLLAFEGNQQPDVDTWLSSFPTLLAVTPALDFVEMPVIERSSGPFRAFVNNGMRSGITDVKARQRTWTLFTDRPAFLQHVGLSDLKQIHALLVTRQGEILWGEHGAAAPERVLRMQAALEKVGAAIR